MAPSPSLASSVYWPRCSACRTARRRPKITREAVVQSTVVAIHQSVVLRALPNAMPWAVSAMLHSPPILRHQTGSTSE